MKNLLLTILASTLLLLQSCGGSNASTLPEGDELVTHAGNLRMMELSEGVTLVTLRNPWDTTKIQARYALLEEGARIPEELPKNVIKINVPLDRSVVYSGVHASLIDELGAGLAVTGICDAEFVNDAKIKAAIGAGKIADCGRNQTPNIELIVSLRPQAVLMSPFEKGDGSEQFGRTGIPVVFTADYMEHTPLGRAEWMRFYGRLYGKGEQADSLFDEIATKYDSLKKSLAQRTASVQGTRPTVLFDRVYSGVWNVPTSGSVTGQFIIDACGTNPFADYGKAGSAQLSVEEVVHKAGNADIWLIRYYEPVLTMKQLEIDNPAYRQIKAFKTGQVYGANTLQVPLFEDGAFHPHLVLEEMAGLLHPVPGSTDTLHYYKKIR